jgi:DNA repair exonuclease SbcCD nuclease subunit
MPKLAFIGDSHLGYRHRFKLERLNDYLASFEEAVLKALSESPDVIVFLGDLFHHSRPDPVSLRAGIKCLLSAAEKTNVVVLVGNHEIEGHLGTTYAPIYSDLHERINVITSENPHIILDLGDKKYGFHGFEYMRDPESVKQALSEVSAELGGDVNILCLHQGIEGYVSPYELSLGLLRSVSERYDLIVSGHVHRNQIISEISDVVPAYYVGATERTSFNEYGNPTGFMVFDCDDFRNPRFVPVSSKPMEYVKKEFRGTPEQLNRFLEAILSKTDAKLLKVEVDAELEGDFLDVRRDFRECEKDMTLLEVNVYPKTKEHESLVMERTALNEEAIERYFEKTGNKSEKLKSLCIELFRKYAG